MNTCIFYGRFILCGSKEENKILKEAVKYFPSSLSIKRGKYSKKIAIFTTTPRFGIVIDPKIRKKCQIILLPSNNFPVKYDPTDKLFRFLVITILHECAHIQGIADEIGAHGQAIQWHDQYIQKYQITANKFTWSEKDDTEDLLLRRDWTYVSKAGDINDDISGRIGCYLVQQFISKCGAEDKGISTVLRQLVKGYVDNSLTLN